MKACKRRYYKSSTKHHDIEELLKENPGDLNTQNRDGTTALMFACGSNIHKGGCPDIEIVKILLNQTNCNVNLQNNDGMTALMFAIANYDCDIINLFLEDKRCKFDLQAYSGTAFIHACRFSALDVVKLLIQSNKFDINARSKKSGANALLSSLIHPSQEPISKLLIENEDCDLNIKTYNGWDLLYTACFQNRENIVKMILKLSPKRYTVDGSLKYSNYQHLIDDYFDKERNRIAVLIMSVKKSKNENPLKILPKEMIHLIISYSHPFSKQTKYL